MIVLAPWAGPIAAWTARAILSELAFAGAEHLIDSTEPLPRDQQGDVMSRVKTGGTVSYSRQVINDAIARVAEETGVPSSYLELVVETENWVSKDEVTTTLTGKYRGLGQFDSSTWAAVSPHPYDRAAEVYPGLLATARLYTANKDTFRRGVGGVFTDAIAYLYHNQGAGNAKRYLLTGDLKYPAQSAQAKRIFNSIGGSYGRRSGAISRNT